MNTNNLTDQIAAVLAWTDSKCQITPLVAKYRDASQEIITIRDIAVLDRRPLPGVGRAMEFFCEAPREDMMIRFRLRYYPMESRWAIYFD